MLLEQRKRVEARARHLDQEVVAAAGAVGDAYLGRLGKRIAKDRFEIGSHDDRLCARYSSRSERVRTPTGRPSRATTTAFLRPRSVENTSSSVCVLSMA